MVQRFGLWASVASAARRSEALHVVQQTDDRWDFAVSIAALGSHPNHFDLLPIFF
jgi:hypothetical protein